MHDAAIALCSIVYKDQTLVTRDEVVLTSDYYIHKIVTIIIGNLYFPPINVPVKMIVKVSNVEK